MNKKFVAFLFLLISLNLSAQTFRFGAITGLNACKLSGNDNSAYNYVGFKFGGRIATDLHRQVRTSIDFLYSRKGNIVNQTPSNLITNKNIRLDYIEVPIMISLMDWMDDPDEEEYYRLHFTFGVSLSKLVNYRVTDNRDFDVTEQQSFYKNKISLLGGLVYYVNEHLGINVQYSNSFTNIQQRSIYPKMKSRTWSVNFIYMLDNKRR